jgi:membrane fusion protein (multidrug efflux system)
MSLQRLRKPLLIGVPMLLLLGLGVLWLLGGRTQSTDDAYVRAAQVTVSANVSGRVLEVPVHDNQHVHKGDVLFRLDERPFRIAVDEARARVSSARLSIEALKATYRQRLADARGAQDEVAYAQREHDRQSKLLKSGIASQAQVDRALQALNAAQQKLAATRQQGTSTRADLDNNPDIEADQHPTVQLALAEAARAELNLSYTIITAPIDGVVTRVESLQPGNYITAATPAFALVSDQDLWVEANFKEDQLAHLRVGQSARIRIDALPDQHLTARVASLSPGTGAEFSVLPPENATGNWVKVVQRLPVRLEIKDPPPGLRAGLSAVVDVDTGMQRHLFSAATAAQP